MTFALLSIACIPILILLGLIVVSCPGRIAWLGIGLVVVAFAGVIGLNIKLPSTAKPTFAEFESVAEADVLWARPDGRRILLLLEWPGSDGPRLYWLPWSREAEAQLRSAGARARARNRQLKIRHPFEGLGLEGPEGKGDGGTGQGRPGNPTGDNDGAEQMFYAPPPTELPPKPQTTETEE